MNRWSPVPVVRFAAFIAVHPELRHVRTKVNTPGQNGVRERAFESLKYERLYREDIIDVLDLTSHAEEFRIEFNTIRPHEALSWNRPLAVHLGLAGRTIPTFERAEILPLS
jgi:transposase InsO family protein